MQVVFVMGAYRYGSLVEWALGKTTHRTIAQSKVPLSCWPTDRKRSHDEHLGIGGTVGGLALVATLLSILLRIPAALSEDIVIAVASPSIGAAVGSAFLGTDESWVKFLAGAGAIVLTFLAGAELDPAVFRLRWKEAGAVGLISFALPFFRLRRQLFGFWWLSCQLARWGCAFHDIGGGCVRGDA